MVGQGSRNLQTWLTQSQTLNSFCSNPARPELGSGRLGGSLGASRAKDQKLLLGHTVQGGVWGIAGALGQPPGSGSITYWPEEAQGASRAAEASRAGKAGPGPTTLRGPHTQSQTQASPEEAAAAGPVTWHAALSPSDLGPLPRSQSAVHTDSDFAPTDQVVDKLAMEAMAPGPAPAPLTSTSGSTRAVSGRPCTAVSLTSMYSRSASAKQATSSTTAPVAGGP